MQLSAVAFSAAFQHFFLLSVIHQENKNKNKKKERNFLTYRKALLEVAKNSLLHPASERFFTPVLYALSILRCLTSYKPWRKYGTGQGSRECLMEKAAYGGFKSSADLEGPQLGLNNRVVAAGLSESSEKWYTVPPTDLDRGEK